MVPNWSFFSSWYLSKGFGWAPWPPVCSHDGHQISYPKTLKPYTCPLPQNPHLSNILVMVQFTSAGWTGQMILSSNQPSFELEKLRQNAQNINFHVTEKKNHHFKGYNSGVFIQKVVQNHLYLVSLLSTQQSNLVPSHSPWQPHIYFLFLWICLFWTFHINALIQYVTFCVWLPSFHKVFKVHLYCSVCQYSILFLLPSNISLLWRYHMYLSIHQLMDIWVVFAF